MKDLNCKLTATKNTKGFITLYLEYEGISCSVLVNDYGGKDKKTARKLAYKIYKTLGGK